MSKLNSREAIRLLRETEDIDTLVDLTRHEDPLVRQKALKEMCPCHVQIDVPEFWARIVEMMDDPDQRVRLQVLHNMCDGSPPHLEGDVADALDQFNRDKDPQIRRMAHKALTAYRKKGKWNVL
ncbi:hypothetical protein CAPTEDRAFT_136883 [Capitella teleta]|uniref:HEAT repeat domain-containing protein n=1 Tax=Capitella teleta TaxID=283909 RepID=R7USV2_CAPTE|nr:hypothetical protein CAPTEDRAFT_136883 [Capitella teleta]|eukprot:ELU09549.1 hypothetical protein CAPTEDRAFT_136883 [Capitella teleta]